MKLFGRQLNPRFASFLAWGLIQIVGHTGRFRIIGYENVRKLVDSGQGFIMALWHGRTMLPVFHCRGMGIWAIVSPSRDGEIQAEILTRFGYQMIRGSSARGGIKAALTAVKKLQEGGILAITPDGPKGPLHEVQEGIVFLAERANCPIIPIGVGASPRKLIPAWDKYLLPMPFAKCAVIYGEPVYAQDTESGEPLESRIKTALDTLQQQAQQMVKEGR